MPQSDLTTALDQVTLARVKLATAEAALKTQLVCEMIRTRTFGLTEEHVRRNYRKAA